METEALKELPACPVETTLTLISDKWKVLILRDLMPGTKRFGELKKSIGHVTQKVLTAQLRQMEESGLSATFRGLFCVREAAFSENAAKLQKKLQFSHQKRRFPIDSLVIIGV